MVLVHLMGEMLRGKGRVKYPLTTPIADVIADFIPDEKERVGCSVMFNNKYYEPEGSLQRIEGIKDHHSVRVMRSRKDLHSAPKNYPPANKEKLRVCQKTIKYMDDFLGTLVAVNDYIPGLLEKYPVLKNEADTLATLNDRQLTMHSFASDATLRGLHPVFVDIVYNFALFFRKLRAQYPEMLIGLEGKEHLEEYVRKGFPDEVGPAERSAASVPSHPQRYQPQATPNITLEMLQNAIFQSVNPQRAPGSSSAGPAAAPAPVAPPAAPAIPSPDQHFAVQLAQMHEFGFTDDGENIQALIIAEGNVEQALEVIISMREG